jgi:hypothetical protein
MYQISFFYQVNMGRTLISVVCVKVFHSKNHKTFLELTPPGGINVTWTTNQGEFTTPRQQKVILDKF